MLLSRILSTTMETCRVTTCWPMDLLFGWGAGRCRFRCINVLPKKILVLTLIFLVFNHMFLGNKGEKKHFFLCMFLGLLIPSPNNLGSYRHRECCFLCSAVANSNDNEGEDTTHPLLYTNFGRDAAYRNSLFGFKLQRPIATPWQRSTQKGFVRL